MKKQDILLSLLFFTLLVIPYTTLTAQVTIGTDAAPVDGAILQLKEDNSLGANSTRGLGLPRLALTTLNDLSDIGTGLDATEHVGLTVFNVAENICTSPMIIKGLYAWDGSAWVHMGREQSADVGVLVDSRDPANPERYFYRQFGAAGTWMLENLRARIFDPVRDNGETILQTLSGPSHTDTNITPLWGYPADPDAVVAPSDDSKFVANPTLGLLYNWAAATNSKGGLTGTDNNANESGDLEGPRRQGICPSGWHLPSDREWTFLENEVQTNTAKYSTTPNIGGTVALPGSASAAAIGVPMKSPCEFYNIEANKGTSKAKEWGGFAGLFAGGINNANPGANPTPPFGFGTLGFFWTNSPAGTVNNVNIRSLYSNISTVLRGVGSRYIYYSVRCKMN